MKNPILEGICGTLSIFVGVIRNLTLPLDRARRVLLGTTLEHLEHVPRRIRGGITRIRCQLHLRLKEAVLVLATEAKPSKVLEMLTKTFLSSRLFG